jgi:predicted nucleic acid-binding protein
MSTRPKRRDRAAAQAKESEKRGEGWAALEARRQYELIFVAIEGQDRSRRRGHATSLAVSTEPSWLIDKSAYVRIPQSPDAEAWRERAERGLIRITTVTLLELGFSARSGAELRAPAIRKPLDQMPVEHLAPRAEDRAVEVQMLLADRGQHRAAAIPDLLIAAVAELAGLVILHDNRDFELISAVTGQPVERVRG